MSTELDAIKVLINSPGRNLLVTNLKKKVKLIESKVWEGESEGDRLKELKKDRKRLLQIIELPEVIKKEYENKEEQSYEDQKDINEVISDHLNTEIAL